MCCNCFFQFVLTEVQRYLDQLPRSLNILDFSPDFILHCRNINYSGWSKTGAVLYGYNFGPSIDSHHRNCQKYVNIHNDNKNITVICIAQLYLEYKFCSEGEFCKIQKVLANKVCLGLYRKILLDNS